MEESLPVTRLRARLAETVNQVCQTGTRVGIQRHGETVAYLVSPADVEVLRQVERRLDLLDILDGLVTAHEIGVARAEDIRAELLRMAGECET